MGFKNTAMKWFMAEEVEEEVVERPRLVKSSGHLNIMVRTPRDFNDVRAYADDLMNGNAIMVSFSTVEPTLKNRIFDYLNGVSYIVDASVHIVDDNMLMYAPSRVTVEKGAPVKRGIFG